MSSSTSQISPGLKPIAFLQCVLNLMSDLSAKEDSDKRLLDLIIQNLLSMLSSLRTETQGDLCTRSEDSELRLMALRTFSILLSKSSYQRGAADNTNFIIHSLLNHLANCDIVSLCLRLLKHLYHDFWTKQPAPLTDDQFQDKMNNNGLIRFTGEHNFYDELAPYFVRDPLNKESFVIPTAAALRLELFDNFSELFTELLVKIPYQIKKFCLSSTPSDSTTLQNHSSALAQINATFDFGSWAHYLCEYLLLPSCHFLKRLNKKLLQILCNSKEKYRKIKDQHILTIRLKQLIALCNPSSDALPPKLNYSNLIKVDEHFKSVLEVAVARTVNWQRFCLQNPSTILYLIELSLLLGVDSNSDSTSGTLCTGASTANLAPTILQLLSYALGGSRTKTQPTAQVPPTPNTASPANPVPATSGPQQTVSAKGI